MKKVLLISFLLFFSFTTPSFAEEEKSIKNNKIGVHILFPEEIEEAARLVNSNGGDYGYVIIPIQAGEKNIKKWQKFMDNARNFHVIPIIRLATEGDYFNTSVWRKPQFADILDFANFLDSLNWPTKKRYIVVFNEVNRGDEWGGSPNPSEYANILSYASTVFKGKSKDFFIISGGFDNASITIYGKSMNEYQFLREMNMAVPGVFKQIDGIGSHSYPNPAFSKPPSKQDSQSVATYLYEKELIESLGGKSNLPVYITETGWSRDFVSDSLASKYYKEALSGIWNNEDIKAITPFLLKAFSKPFSSFSLINPDGSKTMQYKAIEGFEKVKGEPELNQVVLGEHEEVKKNLPVKVFNEKTDPKTQEESTILMFKTVLKFFLRIE